MIRLIVSFVLTFFCFGLEAYAQGDFYDMNTIQHIEVFFSDDNWDYQLDTAKYGADAYTLADSVRINGQVFFNVGVKYKGNSSYDSTFAKNPLHVSLDEFVNQDYQGHSSIKLSNCYADPSMVREVLSYEILRNYMHAPHSNFAEVFVNGELLGLYSNDEHVGKNFCENHFLSPNGVLIKCNPLVNPGPSTKSNLKYVDADSTSYMNNYEVKSNWGWNELVGLCDVITNNPTAIADHVDVDRVLWMLAFNNVLVNLDSYSGVFAQNYYLYRDTTGRFNPVIWDLNMCFAGFPFVGSGNSSMGSLSVTNLQQLPVILHATDAYWPLIKVMMNEPLYRRMYMAHVRTITEEIIASNYYVDRALALQGLIAEEVVADQNKFFSDADFDASMATSVSLGNYDVPGIAELMGARLEFLSSDAEFVLQSPVIDTWQATDMAPSIGQSFFMTATVESAQNVWLGKRYSAASKFTRLPMWDDGAHQDGLAGDGIYGVEVTMAGDSMQFYIYAEDLDAGVFSPRRAEHEFHVMFSSGVRVNEMSQHIALAAYPNPTSGLLVFPKAFENNTLIEVFDLQGARVMSFMTSKGQCTIDMNSLPNGIYVLSCNNNHQRIHLIH